MQVDTKRDVVLLRQALPPRLFVRLRRQAHLGSNGTPRRARYVDASRFDIVVESKAKSGKSTSELNMTFSFNLRAYRTHCMVKPQSEMRTCY